MEDSEASVHPANSLLLFVCGDVMLGRGIDQILLYPSTGELHEPAIENAAAYVALAERASGPIPRGVSSTYVWGEALRELEAFAPDARIINLETAITRSDTWFPKGINYRMHPRNVGCLTSARIDCCMLANNHVLDYDRPGLEETLRALHRVGVKTAGAGRNLAEARAPAIVSTRSGHRVIIVGVGSESSGIPYEWAATEDKSGVYLLEATRARHDFISEMAADVARIGQPDDVIIASVHWGGNWGYAVPSWQQELAHELVDRAGVHLVHGHSSHHPKPIEVYNNRLILYGCGDFLNDYEGISGYEEYRDDLVLMYFACFIPATGKLDSLRMKPMRIQRFSLHGASDRQVRWLRDTLDRECAPFRSSIEIEPGDMLTLRWK